ncbi:MAG: DUF2306 domain-containing protein [Myxococcota bacterium]
MELGIKALMSLVLAAGCVLVLASSVAYLIPGATHPFLDERPWLSANALWRATLTLHVGSGVFCLPLGALLLSNRLALRWPRFHRILGRSYAIVLLFGMVPSGTYLSLFAKGGFATGSGFLLSGLFAAGCTVQGVRSATQGRIAQHREWMWRAYGQLASAITFRIVHLALQFTDMPYDTLYLVSLWTSVVGNAVIVEVIIYSLSRSSAQPASDWRTHHKGVSPCVHPI